jgi:hypothetical protein
LEDFYFTAVGVEQGFEVMASPTAKDNRKTANYDILVLVGF